MIFILIFLRNPYFAHSQVLLIGSLVSELFSFLLFDLSFPSGYFWSATSSFTLKLQWGAGGVLPKYDLVIIFDYGVILSPKVNGSELHFP